MRTLASRALAALVGAVLLAFVRTWSGVRAHWRGCQPGARQRVYFANHASHADLVLIWAGLPQPWRHRTRPVAGQDYWLTGPVRRFVAARVFRALLIDRHPAPDQPSPVEQMASALAAGDSLILFPEGTRNTTDAPLLPLRTGLYHLSRAWPHAEFVPVWLHNSRRILPKGEVVPVPVLCTATFGAPLVLHPQEDKDAFLQRAAAALLSLRPDAPLARTAVTTA